MNGKNDNDSKDIIEQVTHGSLKRKGNKYYSVNVSERSSN